MREGADDAGGEGAHDAAGLRSPGVPTPARPRPDRAAVTGADRRTAGGAVGTA
ncbi:hypothetical protein [Streptomyces filamentosus]|uniref:hypothetical protein n=1 Tax=Streptomyces filamentosus TaxID=67294 RepID=UPI0033341ED2